MNIIVAMKQVPDLHHIRIRNREPALDDIPIVLGDIDKSALAAAVELKETTQGRVIIMSAGNGKIRDTVKEALAAGGDEAILIEDDDLADADSSVIAGVLAAAIQRIGDVGIVVFGEGSADNYSGRVFSAGRACCAGAVVKSPWLCGQSGHGNDAFNRRVERYIMYGNPT